MSRITKADVWTLYECDMLDFAACVDELEAALVRGLRKPSGDHSVWAHLGEVGHRFVCLVERCAPYHDICIGDWVYWVASQWVDHYDYRLGLEHIRGSYSVPLVEELDQDGRVVKRCGVFYPSHLARTIRQEIEMMKPWGAPRTWTVPGRAAQLRALVKEAA